MQRGVAIHIPGPVAGINSGIRKTETAGQRMVILASFYHLTEIAGQY
jgi:hypothetical protein